jgi:hypothetical protein
MDMVFGKHFSMAGSYQWDLPEPDPPLPAGVEG